MVSEIGAPCELLCPWIDDPHARLLAKVGAEINAERRPDVLEATAHIDLGRRTLPRLIFEFAPSTPIEANNSADGEPGRGVPKPTEPCGAVSRWPSTMKSFCFASPPKMGWFSSTRHLARGACCLQ